MSADPRAGLSLDQAPPISIPFRFFLVAPLFGILAGIAVLPPSITHAEGIVDRWSSQTLAATHLLTLGFLALVMMGAMLQMLPVLAGSRVPRARAVAAILFFSLVPGISGLTAALFYPQAVPPNLLTAALIFIGIGVVTFLAATGASLATAKTTPTTTAMRCALAGLAVTATLGLLLGSNHAFGWWVGSRPGWTNTHALWGIAAWIGALLAGVSFQVVPMFQLTPPYPRLTRWMVPGLLTVVVLWTLSPGGGSGASALLVLLLALAATYAVVTVRLQLQRKRRVFDGTLRFWQIGLLSLLAASVAMVAVPTNHAYVAHKDWLVGALLLPGFAVSMVTGMLYRIVPFLVWFHLQSALLMTGGEVPHMRGIIPDEAMRLHLVLHAAALASLIASAFWPPLLLWAAPALSLSMALLAWNMFRAVLVYRRYITR